jgi:Helix-turn-helix domain
MTQSRFSFTQDGQEPLPGMYEATPMEMAAQFATIDRARVHRRSVEMAAPECRIDRNLFSRIMVAAVAIERASYKHRTRYQHRGVLGDLSIALLAALMNFGRKYGQIFPDYDTLAAILRKDPETIVEAMKRLIQHRFVTKHRRSKLIGTPQGQRRVQDSNAYEIHEPTAGLAVVPIVADKVAASGSDNSVVSDLQHRDRHENLAQRPKEERFWLAEPWRMADGSIY